MDDGTDRPGCKQTVSDVGNTVVIGCFSRAVAYTLDFTTTRRRSSGSSRSRSTRSRSS